MNRAALCCLIVAAVPEPGLSMSAEERPNIVLFITDDQSQADAVPYGARELHTPHMQRLADAGVTFTRAYAASPTCAPSRAAFLTGLMPARNGAEPNHSKPRAEVKKWPAYFQELGYEVVAFGKVSHYRHTVDYGFDFFAYDTFHDHRGIPAAVDYLKQRERRGAKPLCLCVGTNWPHVPWPEDTEGYDPRRLSLPAGNVDTPATRQWRARYAAAVTKADDDLGVILDATQAALGKQTVFAFFADQGAQWPWGKWNCYEAGIRVPLIVAWPGTVAQQTRSAALVSLVDVLPTLIEAAGGTPPPGIDGRSFLAVLRGAQSSHRDGVFASHSGDGHWNVYPIRSLSTPDWKYIRNLHPEFAFTSHIDLPGDLGQRAFFSTWEEAARSDPRAARLVQRYHGRPAEELYDLAADPDEQHNLAADARHAARLAEMRAQLDSWMEAQGDQGTVFGKPRLLSDPDSFGPNAPGGALPRKPAAKRKP